MMHNFVVFRKLNTGDVKKLRALAIRTFSEKFTEDNTDDNLEKYITTAFNEEKLLTELKSADCEFYFTLVNTNVVGYMKLNSGNAQTEPMGNEMLELERIYVLKEYQGKKIGSAMLKKAITFARDRKYTCIWLGVWEENKAAIAFYQRFGFEAFGTHDFMLGNDRQTDVLMKLEIEDHETNIS